MDSVIHPEDSYQYPEELHIPPLTAANILRGIETQASIPSPILQLGYSDQAIGQEHEAQISDQHLTHRKSSSSFLDEVRRAFQDFLSKDPSRPNRIVLRDSSRVEKISGPQEMEFLDTSEEDREAALSVARPESRIGQSWPIDAMDQGDLE